MQLLSEIKRRPVEQYLTPTQRHVRDQICDLLQFPNRICLYGPCGSGKTFVAWAVVKAIGAKHVPLPSQLNSLIPPIDCLIIDNAPHYENEVRRLLAVSNLVGASSVIFVSRSPLSIPMHRIELPLPCKEEVDEVLKTYSRFGYYQQGDLPSHPNFWQLLLASV